MYTDISNNYTFIKCLDNDSSYKPLIDTFLEKNNVTSLYLDCNTPLFLALNDNRIIGMLTYIPVDDDTVEISCFTEPEHIKNGILSALVACLKKHLTSSYGEMANINIITAFSDWPDSCHISKEFYYSEYLMELTKNDYFEYIEAKTDTGSGLMADCCFSDDYLDYLLYIDTDSPLPYKDEIINGDEPVAVCSLSYYDDFTNISGVFVDENLRRSGIGYSLISNLCRDYFDEFDVPLILNVTSTNTAALRLYSKCGFKLKEQVDFYKIL